jgi:sugar phosphate isomerase/epimerase
MKSKIMAALMLASTTAIFAAGANPVGIQLWSLRNQLKDNVPAGLDLVKSLGFTAVETAGTYNVSAKEFRALADARGLKLVAGHFGYEQLRDKLPDAIAEAKTLGVSYVVTAWIPHKGEFTPEDAHAAAAVLNQVGAGLKAAGISFGLHTHGYEFKPLADGTSAFDILLKETDPKLVFIEMDVFWVVSAGQDPVKLLNKYPGRFLMFHVKDMRKGAMTGQYTGGAPVDDNVPVGSGLMDWPSIFATGDKTGVNWSFIEDETSDPVKNIPTSVAYLKTLGRKQ